ncbi:hypothetical protein OG455_28330 [Kitasatospora sp. NBC_01287]|uniref:hypothetical protein n=1 Tax=Kitasatospora sp. NBC_01287 TaxID=2903573 RepID=UPI0022572AFF|nr:hypothetical protein [Kitasatospora sp. NBC_01287]MCX4749370.1 hypothetical protein [Kitasatospora sp. NBC_01287]
MMFGKALPSLGLALLTVLAMTTPAAAASRPAARPLPAPRAAGAVLTGASVTFHSDHDQKDRDTLVTVTVRDLNGTTAARISSTFGQFDQYSDVGPY